MARQRARELELSDGELVIARRQLDTLHDRLYVLACAIDDVDRDLRASRQLSASEYKDALEWILDAARPLRDASLQPSA